MKTVKWLVPVVLISIVVILLIFTGEKPFKPLDVAAVTSQDEQCQGLYQRHVEAWDSRDTENFRQIYTDDIILIDGDPAGTGVEGLDSIGSAMFDIFPNWQMEVGATYISGDQCLGTWLNWGMLGFAQEEPGFEFDVIKAQDGKISYWRAFYDQNFHQAIYNSDLVNDELLENYASAWSSGDVDTVMAIYAEDADLEDSLLGFTITGQDAIRDYADQFLATSRGASWEVVRSFAESLPHGSYKEQHPYPSQGAVYAIQLKGKGGSPCAIRVGVILTPNGDGLIQSQQVFYDADTLIACGWAK